MKLYGYLILESCVCLQDVGHGVLESYSRVLESMAFNVTARIDDVLYVDDSMRRSIKNLYTGLQETWLLLKWRMVISHNR